MSSRNYYRVIKILIIVNDFLINTSNKKIKIKKLERVCKIMVMKNNGHERESTGKRYKRIKCCGCGKKLDVQEYIDNHDFDYLDGCNNKINIYCDECSCSNLVKL